MTTSRETGATEDAISWVIHSEHDRREAHRLLDSCKIPSTLTLTPPKASDELTSRMHCAIRCVSEQVMWCGRRMTESEWKLMFVASMFGQEALPSPDGNGFVVLQKQTRNMSGPQKFDLVEFIYSFGAEHGVIFDSD